MILTINNLIEAINRTTYFSPFIDDEDLEQSVVRIVLALINDQDINFGIKSTNEEVVNHCHIKDHEDLVSSINGSISILVFQTSGTTGAPKTVKKTINKIKKGIIVKEALYNAVWGFCYSTRHISGLYVMLQAIYTKSALIDLRNISGNALVESLIQNNVSNISAPTTFFKLNFPLAQTVQSVKMITNGGEPLSTDVYNNILNSCPNCAIKNVYASTEFGSLLVSNNENFTIPESLKETIKIIDNKIWVHKSLLSEFEGANVEWFDTKDKVQVLIDGSFKILGRMSEDVKVLGHLVSLRKLEEVISKSSQVKMCQIKTKPHRVFGTLLKCNIVPNDIDSFNMKKFKDYLKNKLRNYEIPQKVEVVEKIETTYTGKLIR